MLVMGGAPVISPADAELGLFMVDATWRYAEVMMKQIERDVAACQPRTLPAHFKTAYPRRQDDCSDPERGLASVEAIYLAYHLMGRDTEGILDGYHWRDQFLHNNFS